MEDKTKNILITTLAVSIIGLGASWVGYRVHAYHLGEEVQTTQKQAAKAKSNYKLKKLRLEDKLFIDGVHSKNPIIASIAQQNGTYTKAENAVNEFFKIQKTYSDVAQYKGRKDQAKKYADNDVLNNADLFGTDESYKAVEALGLSSSYTSSQTWIEKIDGDNVTLLTKVRYSSRYTGSSSGNGTILYEVGFNTKDNKITSVNKLTSSAWGE